MTSTLDALYPDLRVRARRVFEDVRLATRLEMRPTETLRPFARQQELFEKGRELQNGVWVIVDRAKVLTFSPPGMSRHAYGLAFDACFRGPDPYLEKHPEGKEIWRIYGASAKAHGLRWGGDWNGNGVLDPNDFDRPHCEISYGLKLTECLALFSENGLPAVWGAIDKIRQVPVASEWSIAETNSIL